jgi:hypothetical protein
VFYRLVYGLYGLGEEEINIMKEKMLSMKRYKYEIWTAFNDQYENRETVFKKCLEYDSLKGVCSILGLTASQARNIISRSPGGELNRQGWTVKGSRAFQILKK